MGSVKSKSVDEDNSNGNSIQKESFSSIQNSLSTNNSLDEDYLVVKNKKSTSPPQSPRQQPASQPFVGRRTLTEPANDQAKKHRSQVRPHSFFEDTNFRVIEENPTENNDIMNSKVTSFQTPNIHKSQYFRSFRYASKRFFGKKNNNNTNNTSHASSSTDSANTDSDKKSTHEDSSELEKGYQKSKSQTDLSRHIKQRGASTNSTSCIIDSKSQSLMEDQTSPKRISTVIKNFRNSLTNLGNFEAPPKESQFNPAKHNQNLKVRDVKMKDKARNANSESGPAKNAKSPVPSLGLENDESQAENQEDQNQNVIEHLKKQIDGLVTQLENVEREDSKIINELSEKIDNIAKMNKNVISSVGVQKNQSSRFNVRNLFGFKSSPQTSPNSSQASFNGDHHSRLHSQNDALLQQQIQIEQMRQQLLNSSAYQYQQNPMNSSYIYSSQSKVFYPNQTHTHSHTHEEDDEEDGHRGHDHATEEDDPISDNSQSFTDISGNAHTHGAAYYNPNYTYGQAGYNRGTYYGQNTPNMTNSYPNYQNQFYQNQANSNLYYNAYKNQQFQQQQQQQSAGGQQIYYNIQTGKYYYQKPNSTNTQTNANSQINSPYFYDPSTGALYSNPNYNPNLNQNGEANDNTDEDISDSSAPSAGVIITEVDDEPEDIDLTKINREKFKDYVDAISLKDE